MTNCVHVCGLVVNSQKKMCSERSGGSASTRSPPRPSCSRRQVWHGAAAAEEGRGPPQASVGVSSWGVGSSHT